MTRRNFNGFGRRARGFSLLEVLVALLVLAFGLLGFALLQTMNVRFVQSANYRTQATNLSYDLIDLMRAQRASTLNGGGYVDASFAAGSVTSKGACAWPTGAAVTAKQNVARWQCQVVKTLGDKASAQVQYNNGQVTVAISWGDQRWDAKDPDSLTSFALVSQL
ncbi:type IV pilus modification protein PilV [Stenotrophomonas sp.]|uniref:type IV pilus modification protein PilV n=1 Tax=Stenotrophomonas sp. TaxID=69392 RepID=UPI00289779F9|nr:type IV pilus modification protein PilV [Stenotrophomonas sp.]